jgi:hypothetical protein
MLTDLDLQHHHWISTPTRGRGTVELCHRVAPGLNNL